MAERLLMIEDDAALSRLVAEYLAPLGFEVTVAGTAAEGLRRRGDGFEVCRRIRKASDIPVIMLTARGDDEDRIAGLEIGADDYLPKPFNPRELLARVRGDALEAFDRSIDVHVSRIRAAIEDDPRRPHGLGLALVRQIARAHEGEVRCLPREGGAARSRSICESEGGRFR